MNEINQQIKGRSSFIRLSIFLKGQIHFKLSFSLDPNQLIEMNQLLHYYKNSTVFWFERHSIAYNFF